MTREEIIEAVNAAFEDMEIPAEELTPEKEFFKDFHPTSYTRNPGSDREILRNA